MVTFKPSELDARQRHQLIISTVCPRPIALASTIDSLGNPNLAPFSFFNAFSSTPPILIFSPNTSVRGGKQKDTLANIKETSEVVINIVNHDMTRQMVLAGYDYEKGVNEFKKAGLTAIPSQIVKPFRVKESPVHFECKVIEIKSLGDNAGRANLVISEVLAIHVNQDVLDDKNRVNPKLLDVVGRLGGFNYARITPKTVFQVPQSKELPVGFDAIPEKIRKRKDISGEDLSKLAEATEFPTSEQVEDFLSHPAIKVFFQSVKNSSDDKMETFITQLKLLIYTEQIDKSWMFIKTLQKEGYI